MRRPDETEVWGFSIGAVIGCVALVAFVSGCSKLPAILDAFTDNAKCIVQNQNLPTDEALKRCATRPENVEHVLEILAAARLESAVEANRAAAVQAEKDQRAGVCK